MQEKSTLERDASKLVRDAALKEIARRSLTVDEIAELLNIMPTGASVLLKRADWALDTALRIAEALDVDVRFAIQEGNPA
jgi:plasmid maintenance system antidote protein VapI